MDIYNKEKKNENRKIDVIANHFVVYKLKDT